MHRCFAWVVHMCLYVGDDDHVIAYSMYFGYWWHSGMKRPGPTLHVIVHETGSTTDMQLALHKWLAGVCISYYSKYLIYNELLITWLSSLWFMFVGKTGSIFESPKPHKTCNG